MALKMFSYTQVWYLSFIYNAFLELNYFMRSRHFSGLVLRIVDSSTPLDINFNIREMFELGK